ncbi:MAG TPA: alpha/beta hydrolase [Actinomycetes bacterium]|nr:alpha/beta hydrolase [Actinomycetes bacterium]
MRLPFVVTGDPSGPPLLLVHPWGEAHGCFDRLAPLLPQSWHVIAMDQKGHGRASKPAAGYALVDLASDLAAFLDALEITRAVVLGSSSGGYVAQQLAVSHPERVAGLVLVGTPRSLRGRPAFAAEVEGLTDPVDPEWVRQSLSWFPTMAPVPSWFVAERVADGLRLPARVWRQALAGLCEAVPPTEVATITAPTLVIWGARDGLLPRADQEALVAAIPDSRLIVYADTGHLVLWEQPGRVAADTAAFVKGCPG